MLLKMQYKKNVSNKKCFIRLNISKTENTYCKNVDFLSLHQHQRNCVVSQIDKNHRLYR